MRNVDLMIELLEEMGNAVDGQIMMVQTMGMSETTRARRHHAELLSDAGLAIWQSDSMIRITNSGYEFLNAINQDPPKYISKCKELLGQGKQLLEVANTVMSIVNAV